jgi:hypothetical protein
MDALPSDVATIAAGVVLAVQPSALQSDKS